VIEKLLRRKEWTEALVTRIQNGTVIWSELSAEQRQRLAKSAPTLQDRLQATIGRLDEGSIRSRAEVVNQFSQALTRAGDPVKGRKLFQSLCASCHKFYGEGASVGPNLQGLTDKSGSFLLTAIVDPNVAVEDRYTSYSVELHDGRSLSGLIAEETPVSLVLLNAGGARESILRSAIQEIRASKLSLMPEGLEANLKPQDLADLIAFVQKGPPESTDGEAKPAK
jgi:putative heme-binding domain-containing protein